MMSAQSSRRLEKELTDRGLVPTGCRFLSLVIEAGKPVVITLQKFPDADEIGRLGAALAAASETKERSTDTTTTDEHET